MRQTTYLWPHYSTLPKHLNWLYNWFIYEFHTIPLRVNTSHQFTSTSILILAQHSDIVVQSATGIYIGSKCAFAIDANKFALICKHTTWVRPSLWWSNKQRPALTCSHIYIYICIYICIWRWIHLLSLKYLCSLKSGHPSLETILVE